jgi:hypothetical protein
MNFDTDPTLFDMSNSNHNNAFDFTFPAPTTIAPSPTVTPIAVTAAPQLEAMPTTMKTIEQLSTVKKTRKRKNTEEENAHCILPEGSRRQRKPRRLSDD